MTHPTNNLFLNIKLLGELDPAHETALFHWRERVFPEEGRGKEWSATRQHLVAYIDEQRPVGHIGFDVFELTAGNRVHKVIGVGGVVARPEYQGRGIPGQLFERLHVLHHRYGAEDLFVLFCPDALVAYYQKHGYQLHRGEVWFRQQGELVPSRFQLMYRGEYLEDARVTLRTPPW